MDQGTINTNRRNGLQVLTSLGVPEGALTALLVALAILTVLPYVAGREFGPYSVPDVLPEGVFWTLALFAPLLWVILLARVFGTPMRKLTRTALGLLVVECLVLIAAFGSSTTLESKELQAVIPSGSEHAFIVELPAVSRATQRLDVNLASLEGIERPLPAGAGVAVGVCGASQAKCEFKQIGVGTTVVERFERGTVRIAVFNFRENATPTRVTLHVAHLRRRYF